VPASRPSRSRSGNFDGFRRTSRPSHGIHIPRDGRAARRPLAGCAFGSSSKPPASTRDGPETMVLQRRDFQVPRIRVIGTKSSASAGVKRTSHVHFKCRSVQTCEASDTIATQRGWERCAPRQNSTGATLHESLFRNSASSARYILNVLSASSSALCLRPWNDSPNLVIAFARPPEISLQ
jgi:hypothetical protein